MEWKNRLYFGDNLKVLREYVADASVDMVYLDPPFNSSATYNVLFKEKTGEESAVRLCSPPRACRGTARITAFEGLAVAPIYDRRLPREEEPAVIDRRYNGPRKLADLMQALLPSTAQDGPTACLAVVATGTGRSQRGLYRKTFRINYGRGRTR